MELTITINRKMTPFTSRTEYSRQVSAKNARAAYNGLLRKVNAANAEYGERHWVIDCIDNATGEVLWHN